ncbi:MAG: carbamoyltransferase HypF, partial [FCB group bacterium]|nr:carbamoyltransferase HypF [FCB group bacterium]
MKTPVRTLKDNTQRRQVFVNGIVQGVGFRPFVYNSALRLGLSGNVANTSDGVLIEIEGPTAKLDQFLRTLTEETPPLAVITEIESKIIPSIGTRGFAILPSESDSKAATLISPDVAVCEDCLAELFDPHDRRYGYPFINCTNCGPRYTIIENIPYDRPFTSMRHFTMCPACQSEYDDPANRRFHAQPNACPDCGPRVTLLDKTQNSINTDDPIGTTADLLKEGYIIAIKGLGGFHLTVDATNAKAIATLRERKGREEKPFALMAPDISTIKEFCELTPAEIQTLRSLQAPIVLLKKRPNRKLADSIAPGNDRLGIMLPYTPLHHLLLRHGFEALVMTSANYSEEPICIENKEAFQRLHQIADYFLVHNRDIYLRSDDSVVIHLAGKLRQIRRSRGYVPQPIFVRSDGPPVLATGGE